MENLDAIIEVNIVSAPQANKYLAAGYLLIGVYPMSSRRTDENGVGYTQQGVTFVVGRDEGVKHIEHPGNNART